MEIFDFTSFWECAKLDFNSAGNATYRTVRTGTAVPVGTYVCPVNLWTTVRSPRPAAIFFAFVPDTGTEDFVCEPDGSWGGGGGAGDGRTARG